MNEKKVILLGASGSIGKSALDVIRQNRKTLEPVLFSVHRDSDTLLSLKEEFPKALLALSGFDKAPDSRIAFTGTQGLLKAIACSGADIAINGIAGAAGLEPSLACIESGMDLALANKETIVMAGPLVLSRAHEKKVKIIPVDSEHSAIYNLLEAYGSSGSNEPSVFNKPGGKDTVDEIILTASGGPFRTISKDKLASVKPEDALAHPTWNMGRKITIDSATLANKGLEVIEAHFLFGFPPEKIRVLVHPQSIVHSMIRLKNGAVYAQLSKPDMRLPIHDALLRPSRGGKTSPWGALDFENLTLDFEKPDTEKFPMPALAYEALKSGPLGPALYNAANEIAVEAFLSLGISFLEIPRVVSYVLENSKGLAAQKEPSDPAVIFEADRKAREQAREFIKSGVKQEPVCLQLK